ncbi:MAG: D-amino-acid transaminase [Pseudomonadota bacterium]
MSRIAYVNGRYVPLAKAEVHVEDRGFQFADSVYEVCEVWCRDIVDMTRHLDRLTRSLKELSMDWPVTRKALEMIMREVITRNRVHTGLVYLQVSRGAARRDFQFPAPGTPTTLVVTSRATLPATRRAAGENGIKAITVPDIRWQRVDIKTTGMTAQVLAKEAAIRAGAKEAFMVDGEGRVTEGSSATAWIVNADGTLITRPKDMGILPGVTRHAIMDYAAAHGIKVEERPFTVEEARDAREAFITSASATVVAVVQIDDKVLGNGAPGSVASGLRDHFHEGVERLPVEQY